MKLFEIKRATNITEFYVDSPDYSEFFSNNIVPNCKPFLDLVYPQTEQTLAGYIKSAKRHLVRGMHIHHPGILHTVPMRTPTGTVPVLSNILSKILVKLAGYDIRRKNALFGTYDEMAAYKFGIVNYIFPIGDFQYHYLDGAEDLNDDLWNIARGDFDFELHVPLTKVNHNTVQAALKDIMTSHEQGTTHTVPSDELQQVERFLMLYMTKMFPLKNDGLVQSFVNGNNTSELIFTVDSYYTIPVDMSWLEG